MLQPSPWPWAPLPESQSQLGVVHERGVGHVERSRAAQGGPREQDVRVIQQERQVVEHGLLVLATRPAEVTKELAAGDHHLVRGVLGSRRSDQTRLMVRDFLFCLSISFFVCFYFFAPAWFGYKHMQKRKLPKKLSKSWSRYTRLTCTTLKSSLAITIIMLIISVVNLMRWKIIIIRLQA